MNAIPCVDVGVVPVQDLHTRLGFPTPLSYPETSLRKPLTQWRMEDDDSPIFRYIYRQFQPTRHLEFGTWQGTGVLYVLEECDATVWTINLLEGELKPDGSWAYGAHFPESEQCALALARKLFRWGKRVVSSSRVTSPNMIGSQTDSFGFIGRYYLERGLGYRVCQIYADSRRWDISNYPLGFFDTCLIDGGHQSDVVLSDTRKAFQLVRSGGLIMWHDFCPVPEVVNSAPAARGVVSAIQAELTQITRQTRDLFWINPSHILIGVRL